MNELKNRGVADVLIAVVEGLKGFPEAINAVFPQTVVQTCIVHLIRHSLEHRRLFLAGTGRAAETIGQQFRFTRNAGIFTRA